jgi:hypothetical protein
MRKSAKLPHMGGGGACVVMAAAAVTSSADASVAYAAASPRIIAVKTPNLLILAPRFEMIGSDLCRVWRTVNEHRNGTPDLHRIGAP